MIDGRSVLTAVIVTAGSCRCRIGERVSGSAYLTGTGVSSTQHASPGYFTKQTSRPASVTLFHYSVRTAHILLALRRVVRSETILNTHDVISVCGIIVPLILHFLILCLFPNNLQDKKNIHPIFNDGFLIIKYQCRPR